MKRVKKYLALVMAMGLMLSSMTVLAAGTYYDEEGNESAGIIIPIDGGGNNYVGTEEPSSGNTPSGKAPGVNDTWQNKNDGQMYTYNGSIWEVVVYGDCDSSTSTDSSEKDSLSSAEQAAIAAAKEKEAEERRVLEEASRGSVILEAIADEEGFENAAQMQDAQAANKTVGEYYNNAVLNTPGIEAATPVAQGGNLVVDGKVTNMTASISKVSVAFVDSVRAAQEGTVLNVVDVRFPAKEAVIGFYMPGVTDGANIAAVQYTDGAWVDVDVKEVRADHVTLDLKNNGIVAFLEK